MNRAPRSFGSLLRGQPHEVIARLSGLLLAGLLLVSAGGYAILHFGLLDRGREYRAEFENAWPLVAGMDVRVSGVVAGSVRGVALTDRGTAEVTFQLGPGVPAPRADASAAIVQDDLLGDTSLEVQPGSSGKPLDGPIPTSRSIQAPRLDDFLNIFRRPVRVGLQALIVELGSAMRSRGTDLNGAILQLRPGFQALDEVTAELRRQNRALGQVVENAQAVTGQLASRTRDLDRLVHGFGQTVTGIALRSGQLDQGLAQLPATLAQTDTTLRDAHDLTDVAAPLSQTVIAAAPALQRVATLLAPYARDLGQASGLAAPSLRLAGNVLRAGAPTLRALSRTGIAQMLNPTGGLFSSLAPILSKVADGIFGSQHGGGLGGVVVPGNDAAAPNVDPARDYLSVYIAITCEAFGIKQGPGCLSKFLSTMLRPGPVPTTQAQADRSTSSARGSRRTRAEGIAGAQSPPKAGTGGSRTPPARPNPASSLGQLLAGAAAPLTGTVNSLVGGHPGAASSGNPLPPLLHYLLGR